MIGVARRLAVFLVACQGVYCLRSVKGNQNVSEAPAVKVLPVTAAAAVVADAQEHLEVQKAKDARKQARLASKMADKAEAAAVEAAREAEEEEAAWEAGAKEEDKKAFQVALKAAEERLAREREAKKANSSHSDLDLKTKKQSKKAKALERKLQASRAQLHQAKKHDAEKKKKKADLLRSEADEAQAALEKLLGITHSVETATHVKKTASTKKTIEEDLEEGDDIDVETAVAKKTVAEPATIRETVTDYDDTIEQARTSPVDSSSSTSDRWKSRADELAVQAKIAEQKLAEADSSLSSNYGTDTQTGSQSSGIGSAVKHFFSGWR